VQLYRIWENKNIRMKTKLKIFNSNVKAVLLYGCETWKVTSSIMQKLQSFINRCLRRILNVRWPDVIINTMLWETTGEKPLELRIKNRKWKWIGHTIRKDENAVERIALDWNPQGTRKTKEDLEEASYGRGTERRKDVEGGEEVGSRQKSLEKLRGSPLLLHRRQ
jgi:hypothetical protein